MSADSSRRDLFAAISLAGVATIGVAAVANAQENAGDAPESDKDDRKPILGPAYFASDLEGLPDVDAFARQKSIQQSPEVDMRRALDAQKEWAKLADALKANQPATTDGSPFASLSLQFTRIEKDFQYSDQAEDTDFSPLHVEPLLDQAADLLDRGIKDRATYDELSAKYLELLLELHEYVDLDEIHKEEEAAGVYSLPFIESSADHQSEALTAESQSASSQRLTTHRAERFTHDALNAQAEAAQLLSWLSLMPAYSYHDQKFRGPEIYELAGAKEYARNHGTKFTLVNANFSLANENLQNFLQTATADYSARATAARAEAKRKKAEWDNANINFQKRRTIVARNYQDTKLQAAVVPDGVLNYGKRLPALKRRFHSDFRNALARLQKVRKGLREIYGYNAPLPKDDSSIEYFDECLEWCRDSIQWLIRFSRQEQTFILPLSLRQLVGDKAWKEGKKAGMWSFEIDRKTFSKMAHVRMRGMALHTVDNSGDDSRLWQIEVTVPKEGECRHLSKTSVSLDQSGVPPLRFGRVTTRRSVREPDILGLSSLHNASPIGIWKVRLQSAIRSDISSDTVTDIEIDLHTVFRATA